MISSNSLLPFEEEQWLKVVFLLSDTQSWINEQQRHLLNLIPMAGKKKLFRQTYYLTAPALAHILERHYFKTQRHPCTGKFTIPLIDIMACIRDLADATSTPLSGTTYLQRSADMGFIVGYDSSCRNSSIVTVITDSGGKVITAYPGNIQS